MRSVTRFCAAAGTLAAAALSGPAASQAAPPVLKLSTAVPSVYRARSSGTTDVVLTAKAVPFVPPASEQLVSLKLVIAQPATSSLPEDRHFWAFDARSLQQSRRSPLVLVIQAAPPTFCRETTITSLRLTAANFSDDIAAAPRGRAYTAVTESELLNLALKGSALAYRCAAMSTGDAQDLANTAAAIANTAYRLLLEHPEYGFRQSGPPPWRFVRG